MSDSYTSTALDKKFSTSHAFLVGIDDYTHLAALQTAVSDARKVAEVLAQQQHFKVYPPLLNATADELNNLLEKTLHEKVGPKDRVFFYYAGHGIADDSDEGPAGYILPVDADPGNKKTFIPMGKFHKAITRLQCRHVLLVLDCCFSGAFKWSDGTRAGGVFRPKKLYKERFDRFISDPAWQVITSASYDQKALDMLLGKPGDRGIDERNREHSPFALALMDGLAGKADVKDGEEGDGVITATELYSYIRDRVEPATIKASEKKRQTPGFFPLGKHDKGEFVFLHPTHRLNLPPVPDQNPYKGLKSYDESDRELFYGRDQVIKDLQAKIPGNRLIVITGPSGSGKSSAIKAGLLPRLRDDGFRILPVIRPGSEPLEVLAEALVQGGLSEQQESLNKGITAALLKAFAEEPTVLLIDQYEELITRCADKDQRDQYVATLRELLDKTGEDDLKIILTLRSDFEPQLDKGYLGEYWQAGRFNVPPFSAEDLKEVVAMPAMQASFIFEPPQLVDKIVEEVLQAPGALPLLSYTMSELYETYVQRSGGSKFRNFNEKDYEKLGGVRGALRSKADRLYQQFDDGLKSTLRNLFLRMVSIEGGEVTSRRAMVNELVYVDEAENERLKKAIAALVDSRLIVSGTSEESGEKYVEPAHDALMRAWGTLYEWINEFGNDTIYLQRRLNQRVIDYLAHQQRHDAGSNFDGDDPRTGESLLWENDPRLDQLKAVLASEDNWLNRRETEFVEESLARRADIIARIEKEREELATRLSRNYMMNARSARDSGNHDLAAHYLARAGATLAQIEKSAAQTISDLFTYHHLQLRLKDIHATSQLVSQPWFNDDGSLLVGIGVHTVYLWRMPNLSHPQELKHRNLDGCVFAGNDSLIISYGGKRICLWRAETGKRIGKPLPYEGDILEHLFELNPENTRLLARASAKDGSTITNIWEIESGKNIFSEKDSDYEFKFEQEVASKLDESWSKLEIWDICANTKKTIQHKDTEDDTADIRMAEFNHDASVLVTCVRDKYIPNEGGMGGKYIYRFYLWQYKENTVLAKWELAENGRDICFSPDGRLILTAFEEGTAFLHHTESGKLIAQIEHLSKMSGHKFSPESDALLTWGHNGYVFLWTNFENPEVVKIPPPKDQLYVKADTIKFHKHNTFVLLGYDDGTIKCLYLSTGDVAGVARHRFDEERMKIWVSNDERERGHVVQEGDVVNALFCLDDELVLSAGGNTVMLWEPYSGKVLAKLHHPETISGEISFVPEIFPAEALTEETTSADKFSDLQNPGILTRTIDNVYRLWDAKSGAMLGMVPECDTLRFDVKSEHFISLSNDGELYCWEYEKTRSTTSMPCGGSVNLIENSEKLVICSTRGEVHLVKAEDGRAVGKSWALCRGEIAEEIQERLDRRNDHVRPPMPRAQFSDGATLNAAGDRVLTWSAELNAVHLWNADNGNLIKEFEFDGQRNISFNFGHLFRRNGRIVKFWANRWEAGPCFNPRGNHVLTRKWDSFQVWDSASGKKMANHPHKGLGSVDYVRGGDALLSWGGKMIRFWDAKSHQPAGIIRHTKVLDDVVFNKGASLVLGSANDSWVLWQQVNKDYVVVAGGAMKHAGPLISDNGEYLVIDGDLWSTEAILRDKAQPVSLMESGTNSNMLFSRDGALLAGWEGNLLSVWRSNDGSAFFPAIRHSSEISGVQISADNRLLLTWTKDHMIHLWHCADGTPAAPSFKYRRDDEVGGAIFNQTGTMIYIWSTYTKVQALDIGANLQFPGKYLPLKVEKITGTTLDELGNLHLMSAAEWEQRRDEYAVIDKENDH